MKLIVQIPCFNEVETLQQTVEAIPRAMSGVDSVEVLVVDDGSGDGTASAARESGVDHFIRHSINRGLASAFSTGLEASILLGADIIVNTDGDNQYDGGDIPRLIRPILEKKADVVIGDRRPWTLKHFSLWKKCLQWLGSSVVRWLTSTSVRDSVSGFRAFSREAACHINLINSFSHTIETIFQCKHKGLAIVSVPVRVHVTTRPSRLAGSTFVFIVRSAATLLRTYAMYSPLKIFWAASIPVSLMGLFAIARFLYFYCVGLGSGHIQSVVLGGACVMIGVTLALFGVVADLISINRQMLEQVLMKVRKIESTQGISDFGAYQPEREGIGK